MDKTTDLNELRTGKPFTWGEVIQIHEIGNNIATYTIVEYYPWKTQGVTVAGDHPDFNKREYHGYVNGKDMSESFASLDSALAGCIAYRFEGSNHRANYYFIKSLEAINNG